jgi:two-component system chemotaxis sensor kinase CheA
MILTRGRLVPLVRLGRIFRVKGDSEQPWEGLVVAVENDGHQRCLLLDELMGKEEVVIKSLGQGLKDVRGIAGGAILGDGRVGLILDISGIFEISQN